MDELNLESIKMDDVEFDDNGYPMQPLLNFHPNSDEQMCVTLWGWDTQESFDGYTPEDITDLITSLQEARDFLLNNDVKQGEFDFELEGEDDA